MVTVSPALHSFDGRLCFSLVGHTLTKHEALRSLAVVDPSMLCNGNPGVPLTGSRFERIR